MRRESGGGAAAVLREEFRLRHLKLHYEYYEYFVYSQWLPAWLLWLLRLAMGGFCLGVFLYLSIHSPFMSFGLRNDTSANSSEEQQELGSVTNQPAEEKTHFYLCFLTVWSYLVIVLYFVVTIGNMVAMKLRLGRSYTLAAGGFKSTEELVEADDDIGRVELRDSGCGGCHHVALKLQWLLCGVAANAAVIVTIGYFGIIYRFVQAANPGRPLQAVDLFLHGLNSVFMFAEVLASGVPVCLLHAAFTALYGLLYGLFSFVYWLTDHTNVIYPVLLDWNNPGLTLAIVSGILLLGLPAIQVFWWTVYLLRCLLARSVLRRQVWNVTGMSV